jgi:apolipoprotein D and lipocalin family protein
MIAMWYKLFCLALGLITFGLTGCADRKPPLKTVDHVDLQRYQGTWYVIANIPYWLENGKVATADRYAMRPDGRMDNVYVFRRKSFDAPEVEWHGVGWVTNTTTNAEWQVRFIWPLSATYLIIDLDPDYRWAVIGHPSRDYFWVLARERQLNDTIYRDILTRAAAQGYDISRVAPVLQPNEAPQAVGTAPAPP